MLITFLKFIARMPLSWFHVLGGCLGRVVYGVSPRYAARLRENLLQSGLSSEDVLKKAVAESGKGIMELLPIWFGDHKNTVSWVRDCRGWAHVQTARDKGKGIIFLTPHLGCFEIAARYAAHHFPMTVLYRPPKLRWLQPLIEQGRGQQQLVLAPADIRGVKMLLRALKRGQAIGILPDQAPGVGEGVWADFFGRRAYTMTLVSRLAAVSGASVLLAFARRLPSGSGYSLSFAPLTQPLASDTQLAAQQLNQELAALIRTCPEQYLWSYNRYKIPAGAAAPAAATSC